MKHIWIIDKASSTPLFYHSYSDLGIDPILASTLLSAFDKFSEVELQQGYGVSYIEMGGYRWVYQSTPDINLLLIAAGDPEENPEIMRAQLDIILDMFVDKYPILGAQDKMGLINVDQFKSFNPLLNDLQDQWNQASIFSESAIVFDLLGIFQQLLNEIHHIITFYFKPPLLENVLTELQDYWENFKNSPDVSQNPAMGLMKFEKIEGWTVININPKFLEVDETKRFFMVMITDLRYFLENYLQKNLANVCSKEIMPFLLSEFDRLEKLGIHRKLFELFGSFSDFEFDFIPYDINK